jgi:hypothetical protein
LCCARLCLQMMTWQRASYRACVQCASVSVLTLEELPPRRRGTRRAPRCDGPAAPHFIPHARGRRALMPPHTYGMCASRRAASCHFVLDPKKSDDHCCMLSPHASDHGCWALGAPIHIYPPVGRPPPAHGARNAPSTLWVVLLPKTIGQDPRVKVSGAARAPAGGCTHNPPPRLGRRSAGVCRRMRAVRACASRAFVSGHPFFAPACYYLDPPTSCCGAAAPFRPESLAPFKPCPVFARGLCLKP